jgi:Spy/CpxP family protein refolding chaperone
MAFFKKTRQVLTIFLAGVLLIVSTACSSATTQEGASPANPPVQIGGQNNPYKGGGSGQVNNKLSTDPRAQSKADIESQAAPSSDRRVAVHKDIELLYPGAETPAGRAKKEAEFPLITEKDFQQPEPGGDIQREPEVGERVKDRVEAVGEAVKEASGFVKAKADEATARPELKRNPALEK